MVSTKIEERLGVFKSIDDVPSRYRFEAFAQSIKQKDVWAEWNAQHSDTEWKQNESRRVRNRWEEHLEPIDRHHALATPQDVNAYVEELQDEMQLERVYKPYWLFLKRFYHWLMWNTEYPHRYNPVLMASANYPASREVWDYVMSLDRKTFK